MHRVAALFRSDTWKTGYIIVKSKLFLSHHVFRLHIDFFPRALQARDLIISRVLLLMIYAWMRRKVKNGIDIPRLPKDFQNFHVASASNL